MSTADQNGAVVGKSIERRSGEPPLKSKVLIAVAVQAFFLSILVAYFEPHVPLMNAVMERLDQMDIPLLDWFIEDAEGTADQDAHPDTAAKVPKRRSDDPLAADTNYKMMSKAELAAMTGANGSPIYLAVLGKVYDVSKGKKHYGPGGGYNFFAGRDASRAYVTGDFSPAGLVDDVSGLTPEDYLSLHEWYTFYDKDYDHVGYVTGTYYYANGAPTENLRDVVKRMDEAHAWQAEQKAVDARFPSCNSEWAQKTGGRVWCTNKSGGVRRDWAGLPRRLFTPGTKDWRCACVKAGGAPQAADLKDTNTGDLKHPNLKPYDDCAPTAVECKLKD